MNRVLHLWRESCMLIVARPLRAAGPLSSALLLLAPTEPADVDCPDDKRDDTDSDTRYE